MHHPHDSEPKIRIQKQMLSMLMFAYRPCTAVILLHGVVCVCANPYAAVAVRCTRTHTEQQAAETALKLAAAKAAELEKMVQAEAARQQQVYSRFSSGSCQFGVPLMCVRIGISVCVCARARAFSTAAATVVPCGCGLRCTGACTDNPTCAHSFCR